jgi:ribosomal protein L40E
VRHVRFDNSLSPAPLSPTAQMNPPIRQPQLPAPSGQTFTSKFCHECGAKHLSTSARFCMGCGAARLA